MVKAALPGRRSLVDTSFREVLVGAGKTSLQIPECGSRTYRTSTPHATPTPGIAASFSLVRNFMATKTVEKLDSLPDSPYCRKQRCDQKNPRQRALSARAMFQNNYARSVLRTGRRPELTLPLHGGGWEKNGLHRQRMVSGCLL